VESGNRGIGWKIKWVNIENCERNSTSLPTLHNQIKVIMQKIFENPAANSFMLKRILAVVLVFIVITGFTSSIHKRADNDTKSGNPLIFPIPLETQIRNGKFIIDKNTYILLAEDKKHNDDFIARSMFNEMVDKHKFPLTIARKSSISMKDKFILIGDISNPLVRAYCEKNKLLAYLKSLGEEGYVLSVNENHVVVAGNTKTGAFYGFQSLRQIIHNDGEKIAVPQLLVKDKPAYEFRGIRLYVPGPENIPYFKRFIKDFVALYKFNKIIMEFNANMRLDSRPELNIGTIEFARYLNFSRLNRPVGPNGEGQTSSHHDAADGRILEKEEVANLVDYIRKYNIEVIPELPSLTHSYYLLFGNEHLAESMHYEYPDNYCPSKPEVYDIYFDVLDEYIEVIKPAMIHVGHDEWRMEKDHCVLCRGKDYGELFAGDLNKIHGYLAKKGIRTAIWGDHILESMRGVGYRERKTKTGYEYKIPGALRPEQVKKSIPKDILMLNWAWGDINNDKQYSDFGFRQIYGNMRPDIDKINERASISGVLGGAASSWAAATELNDGKDLLFDYLGVANLLWSKHYLDYENLVLAVEPLIGDIRAKLSGKELPSDVGSRVSPIDISSHFNTSLSNGIDNVEYSNLIIGELKAGNKKFVLGSHKQRDKKAISVITSQNAGSRSVEGIKINKDVNSLLFLHACANKASNIKSYFSIHNHIETAQLLGWYEVVYEDGIIVTIPLRYGLNILDWTWRNRLGNNTDTNQQKEYAYQASAVQCSSNPASPVTFFAYEWENPRYGVPVSEINIKSAKYVDGNENAVILLAVSISSTVALEDVKVAEDY
jgi:hypothetical protein